jgi:hypothetical protein
MNKEKTEKTEKEITKDLVKYKIDNICFLGRLENFLNARSIKYEKRDEYLIIPTTEYISSDVMERIIKAEFKISYRFGKIDIMPSIFTITERSSNKVYI